MRKATLFILVVLLGIVSGNSIPKKTHHTFQNKPNCKKEFFRSLGRSNARAIVLRVDFPDLAFDMVPDFPDSAAHDYDYFERQYFHLKTFLDESSNGHLTFEYDISENIKTMPGNESYYGDNSNVNEKLTELLRDAVHAFDNEIDFSAYEFVYVAHAGIGEESDVNNDSPDQIWSTYISESNIDDYYPNGITTNDNVSIDEGVIIPESQNQDFPYPDPQTTAEYQLNAPYINGMLGVLLYETGKLLGLPDLSDTTPEGSSDSWGIGTWDVMSMGAWNFNGYCPADFSCWSKIRLGWIDNIMVLDEAADSVEIAAYGLPTEEANGLPQVIKIPISSTEYFLLENRLQDENGDGIFNFNDVNQNGTFNFFVDTYEGAEVDFFTPHYTSVNDSGVVFVSEFGSGLIIYHIDESVIEQNIDNNEINGNGFHKGVDIEEADGYQHFDQPYLTAEIWNPRDTYRSWLSNESPLTLNNFSPQTTPNSNGYYGKSNIYIENISTIGRIMKFNLRYSSYYGSFPVSLNAGGLDTLTIDENIFAEPVITNFDGYGNNEILFMDGLGNYFNIFENSIYTSMFLNNKEPLCSALLFPDGNGSNSFILPFRNVGGGVDESWLFKVNPDGTFDNIYPQVGNARILSASIYGSDIVLCQELNADGSGLLSVLYEDGTGSVLQYSEGNILPYPVYCGEDYWMKFVFADVVENKLMIAKHDDSMIEIEDNLCSIYNSGKSYLTAMQDEQYTYIYYITTGNLETLKELKIDNNETGSYTNRDIHEFTNPIVSPIVIMDIDNNGFEDFAVVDNQSQIHVVNKNGAVSKGFPHDFELDIAADSFVTPSIYSRDDDKFIICNFGEYGIKGIDSEGNSVNEFDCVLPSPVASPVAINDINNDGLMEMFIHSTDRKLYVIEPGEDFTIDFTEDFYTTQGIYRSGHIGNYQRCNIFSIDNISNPGNPGSEIFDKSASFFIYPNPAARKDAKIRFSLKQSALLEVKIFDISGDMVYDINKENQHGGVEEIIVKTDKFASGIYICHIKATAGSFSEKKTLKLAIIK